MFIRILWLGGVAGPALFSAMVVICAALRPGYSHVEEFISALGAQGTPHAALMNLAGFVPSGLLIAAFGISFTLEALRSPLRIAVGILVGLFGLGMAVAGLYSCDPGCPQPPISRAAVIHDRVSPVAFISVLLAITLSTFLFRRHTPFRSLWLYSALASLAALWFFVALLVSLSSGGPTGLWQRLFLGTVFGWCMLVSLQHYRLPVRNDA